MDFVRQQFDNAYGKVVAIERTGPSLATNHVLYAKRTDMTIRDLRAIGSEILDVLPALLPAIIMFLLMPIGLYLANRDVLDYNPDFVAPYLAVAAVYFVAIVPILARVTDPPRSTVVALLFYIGLFMALSDILAPVQLGELATGAEEVREPPYLTVIEVALAMIVVVCALKLTWKRVARFASLFVLVLLASEAVIVCKELSPKTAWSEAERSMKQHSNPERLATGGNIYHIILDNYGGLTLLRALDELDLTAEFDGFTYFKNNRSNYIFTAFSTASFMTGTFYQEDQNLGQWTTQHTSSGIVKDLSDAGYEVSVYARDTRYVHQDASHVTVHKDVLLPYESRSRFCQFADLWLLRLVPNFLQQEVYSEGKGIFTRLFVKEDRLAGQNADVFAALQLMRQLIADESRRPDHGQYVYAYLYFPHPPYIMNRHCVFSPDSDYDQQAYCATTLLAQLVSKLKQLGRYHDSVIVIHSDHGRPSTGKDAPGDTLSGADQKLIDAVNLSRYQAVALDNRVRALLLIKPPLRSGQPLLVSNRATQLADIRATIGDLVGLPTQPEEGESVFSPDFPQTREIHIFVGFKQTDESGKPIQFGKDLLEGEANHFSFVNGEGWQIYPNIHVRW